MATTNSKNDADAKSKTANAEQKKKESKKDAKNKKPGLAERATAYFKGVKSEIKRVTWPSKDELVKYTGAVVGMLIFFGILIAIVDAVIVPVLYAYQGLR